MSDSLIKIDSITQLHELVGAPKPDHPLISALRGTEIANAAPMPKGTQISLGFYQIWLKGGHCGVQYGRKHYDFEEGVLSFFAPYKMATITEDTRQEGAEGWVIFFHPDLVRTSPLFDEVKNFGFFDYESHEALHLSDREKATVTEAMERISEEIEDRIDNHSQRVIVSNLHLLFNYISRYYERQFNTRSTANKAIVTQVDEVLNKYFESGDLSMNGQPSVNLLADEVHLSPNYLSDLLLKEVGHSAKDHINAFLVSKAKTALLTTDLSISQIAYDLGFNYPHYFSRLFKQKTGITPNEFSAVN